MEHLQAPATPINATAARKGGHSGLEAQGGFVAAFFRRDDDGFHDGCQPLPGLGRLPGGDLLDEAEGGHQPVGRGLPGALRGGDLTDAWGQLRGSSSVSFPVAGCFRMLEYVPAPHSAHFPYSSSTSMLGVVEPGVPAWRQEAASATPRCLSLRVEHYQIII